MVICFSDSPRQASWMGPVAHHVVTCGRRRAVKCENLLEVTLTYHEGIFLCYVF